ncbi:urease accessory protein UreF [Vibrio sp. SM6]|uniref:Urease accessory protein UreF n=2 Tax=Vibrio agarilyticus TaxID=2726741 RepID=A0A7X8YIG2_9VIBR|nr:urease accessory UreF family protein [Vibrio agarilyticus]NLS14694.1 urease accessory protein UreF [Vibrio agarilyticus]
MTKPKLAKPSANSVNLTDSLSGEGAGSQVSIYRLFQLISPSLPIGGFTYSQGVEYAVEAQWITNRTELEEWLVYVLGSSVATLELPILERFYWALENRPLSELSREELEYWSDYLYASRETSELRAEERQRGLALNTLLKQLAMDVTPVTTLNCPPNQLLGFALAAHHWNIPLSELKQGYLWSWLENMVTAGVKLIPLGQTDGQLALLKVSEHFPQFIERASLVEDWMVGSFSPSVALASALHETQYTRLFRS